MKLLIWVCLSQAIWSQALGIYHEKSKKMFLPPKALRNDSFFGYSITYDQQNHQLIISSPRENDIGEVYECNIPKKECKQIENNNITRISGTFNHDYWFGATVKAGPDFVVMCTPRYIDRYIIYNELGTFGRCYSYSHGILTLLPSIHPNERKADSPKLFEATMDSFGWSLDVAFDDSIIVGGPGMFTGRAMIYRERQWHTPVFIRKDKFTPYFNFGYGVSSGTFINDKMSYAVSSTYGIDGSGEVQFFVGIERQNKLPKIEDKKIVGSMFGAVLCAARLRGVRTDLLVGAPTYAMKSTYNTGAVYVYLSLQKSKPPTHRRTIKGAKDGGLFGSAIISLGDLNGDNKDEIAIGAPFENGDRGAVYLYSGAELASDKTELALKYLQKIEPEAHSAFGKGFGLSLTTLQDYDDNGCNELAIGAPYSDAVFLLHCFAAITVKVTATFPNLQNRALSGKTKTDFQFKVCLIVEYPLKPRSIIARMSTRVQMSHVSARLKKTDSKGILAFETSLNDKQPEYCHPVDFTLPPDGNYNSVIHYYVTSSLLNNPLEFDQFNGSQVILSDRSTLTLHGTVSAAECSGQECVPNLQSNFSSSFNAPTYKVGSTNSEYFDISLKNTGEVAYEACVLVNVTGVGVSSPSRDCNLIDKHSLRCAPTKPLRTGTIWTTGKNILDMGSLTNLNRNVTIKVFIYNRCKVPKFENYSRVIFLKGDPEGVDVMGETNLGKIVNMTNTEIQNDGKDMEHIYTIVNKGVTDWVGLTSIVTLQKKLYIKYPKPVKVYVGSSVSDCFLFPPKSEDVMNFICNISTIVGIHDYKELEKKIIKIVIPMNIVAGTLDGILEVDNNVTINSYMTLFLEHGNITDTISESIVSTIVLRDAVVELWVILLATLAGLILLIIIAWILYKCGFLHRKKREELKNLRRSIKRQTIRRSMMQTQPTPEDRRQILERMNEENEHDHNEGAVI